MNTLLHAYVKPSDDKSSLNLFYESIPNFLLTEAFVYDLFTDISDPWFLRSILIENFVGKTVINRRVFWN